MEQNEHREVYALVFSQKHVCLQVIYIFLDFWYFYIYNIFCIPQDFLTKSIKDTISELQCTYFPSVKLIQTKIPNKSPVITNIIDGNVQQKLNLKKGDVLFLACGEKVNTVNINLLIIFSTFINDTLTSSSYIY